MKSVVLLINGPRRTSPDHLSYIRDAQCLYKELWDGGIPAYFADIHELISADETQQQIMCQHALFVCDSICVDSVSALPPRASVLAILQNKGDCRIVRSVKRVESVERPKAMKHITKALTK